MASNVPGPMVPRLLSLALALLLWSCTGYKLGGSKPSHLSEVQSISVSMVKNETQMPRAAAHATNSLIDALTRDGTYQLGTVAQADARLEATIATITYSQARSKRADTLASEELEMRVELEWTLIDGQDPSRVLQSGRTRGTTRLFVDANLQTARQSALPDALKRASESLIARLADGF